VRSRIELFFSQLTDSVWGGDLAHRVFMVDGQGCALESFPGRIVEVEVGTHKSQFQFSDQPRDKSPTEHSSFNILLL